MCVCICICICKCIQFCNGVICVCGAAASAVPEAIHFVMRGGEGRSAAGGNLMRNRPTTYSSWQAAANSRQHKMKKSLQNQFGSIWGGSAANLGHIFVL